jgi:hypothetical protein
LEGKAIMRIVHGAKAEEVAPVVEEETVPQASTPPKEDTAPDPVKDRPDDLPGSAGFSPA